MAEAAQGRVQSAIKDFVNTVDRSFLRSYERRMHLCAAECCSDQAAYVEDVHRCIESCQAPARKSQQYVQSELERFQESLSRCVLQCQDEVKDKVGPKTTEAEISGFRTEFENCAIACCDKSITKLPPLMDKLKAAFDSGAI